MTCQIGFATDHDQIYYVLICLNFPLNFKMQSNSRIQLNRNKENPCYPCDTNILVPENTKPISSS